MVGFREPIRRWELIALIAILIAAIVLRVWRLDSVPPGLTHDEASNGHDAAAVLRGVRPIYFTVGYGHEPLYPYSVALSMALLGPTDLALRLTTVAWALVLILLSYLLTRRLFGAAPALIAAAWMAVSFWCVMTSRVGLRAITSAVTFSASAYALWRAMLTGGSAREGEGSPLPSPAKGRTWLWWALSGLFLGASIYTYMASRAMPAVYGLFVVYLALMHAFRRRGKSESGMISHEDKTLDRRGAWARRLSSQWRGSLIGVVALLLIAALVAAPLIHYLVTHPGAEQRLGQLSGPIKDALRGRFGGLWSRVSRSLPMITVQGDPLWLYNIPGRPLLDVVGAAFFYTGLVACLWRWRDPRCVFVLLWLLVGVSPALVTGPDATALRSITAQPAIFIVLALGLWTILRFFSRSFARWSSGVTVGVVAALVVVTAARTARAYFDVWAQNPDVRVAYHHALVEQSHYLDDQPEGGAVALSSIYPGRFHDPYTMEITLHRDDLSLRWFDGRHALVFPDSPESRVVIPTIAPLDEVLSPFFTSHAHRLHSRRFRPDDLIEGFDVYRFDGEHALTALLSTAGDNPLFWSPSDTYPVGRPRSTYEPLNGPVNVGGVVDLLSYDLRTPTVEPGGQIVLLAVWRVRDTVQRAPHAPLASELVAFTHLLDSGGSVVGQRDRLDVPSWHWQPGDAFVQLHRFPVKDDLSPGSYSLEIGFYARGDATRLPVVVGDTLVDDRILLRPVEVVGQ